MARWRLSSFARGAACSPRKTTKILAAEPPDVEVARKCCLRSLQASENARECSLRSRFFRKEFHGAERIIEKEFEKEFEKECRSPKLEDAALKKAPLTDASLRAWNARNHIRISCVARSCCLVHWSQAGAFHT